MNETWRTSTHTNGGTACVETRALWRTSTYSTGENNCVEFRQPGAKAVQVRDTKDRGRGTITVGAEAWEKFLQM
jgi:hypothetical protein